jgi:hypothetical protein
MPRLLLSGLALLVLGFTSQAFGQTREELLKENEELKARLKALEAKLEAQTEDEKSKAVIVGYDVATQRLVLKVGTKERTVQLEATTHVHDVDGSHVELANRSAKLRPGVEVTVVEEDGEISSVNLGSGKHRHDHNGHRHTKHEPCKKHQPKDQFDFFRPFHSHCDHQNHEHASDGHDHGNGKVHDHENRRAHAHESDNGHDHEDGANGHADAHGHGHAEGHDRHESVYGYPFFHGLRTEHAFIERKTELQFIRGKGREAGTLDETALEGEFFWALNNRIAFFMEGPYIWRNPDEADNTSGIGDLEFGLQFVAFNSRHLILSFGLGVETPIGDADRGLGEGHAVLEPKFLGLIDFGCGWVFQQDLRLELPIFVEEDVENEFIYNFALGKTILATGKGHFIQWLTPGVEVCGRSTLNGREAGLNILEVMPALYWVIREKNHFGLGVSVPVGGHQDLDYEVRFGWFRHF